MIDLAEWIALAAIFISWFGTGILCNGSGLFRCAGTGWGNSVFTKRGLQEKDGDEENLKKNHYEKRNRGICEKHQNGSRVSELAEEYALSEKSIQRILRCTAADGKKYGLNTKTERQPWKNPRAVFCISVAFFPFFLAFQKDAVIIRESE